eukprot:403336961
MQGLNTERLNTQGSNDFMNQSEISQSNNPIQYKELYGVKYAVPSTPQNIKVVSFQDVIKKESEINDSSLTYQTAHSQQQVPRIDSQNNTQRQSQQAALKKPPKIQMKAKLETGVQVKKQPNIHNKTSYNSRAGSKSKAGHESSLEYQSSGGLNNTQKLNSGYFNIPKSSNLLNGALNSIAQKIKTKNQNSIQNSKQQSIERQSSLTNKTASMNNKPQQIQKFRPATQQQQLRNQSRNSQQEPETIKRRTSAYKKVSHEYGSKNIVQPQNQKQPSISPIRNQVLFKQHLDDEITHSDKNIYGFSTQETQNQVNRNQALRTPNPTDITNGQNSTKSQQFSRISAYQSNSVNRQKKQQKQETPNNLQSNFISSFNDNEAPKNQNVWLSESDKAVMSQIKQILVKAQNKSTSFVKDLESLIKKYEQQNLSQNLTPIESQSTKPIEKQIKQENISSAYFKSFRNIAKPQKEEFSISICFLLLLSTSNTKIPLNIDRSNILDKSWDQMRKYLCNSKLMLHLKLIKENIVGNHLKKKQLRTIQNEIQNINGQLNNLSSQLILNYVIQSAQLAQLVKLNKRIKNFKTTERYTSDRYTWNTENHKNLVQQKLEDDFSEELSRFDNKQSPIRDIRDNKIVETNDDLNDRVYQEDMHIKTSHQLPKQQQLMSEDEYMNPRYISKNLIKEQNTLQIDTSNNQLDNDDCESFWNLPMQMESEPLKKVKFLDDEVKKEMQFLQIVNQPNNFEQSNNSSRKELTSIQQQIVIKKKNGRQAKVSSQQRMIANSRSPDIRQKSPDQKNMTQIISMNSHDFEPENQYNKISKANFDISSRLNQFLLGIGKQNLQSSSMIEPMNSNSFVNEVNSVKQPRKIVISSKKHI